MSVTIVINTSELSWYGILTGYLTLLKEVLPEATVLDCAKIAEWDGVHQLDTKSKLKGQTIINLGTHSYLGGVGLNRLADLYQQAERVVVLMEDYKARFATQLRRAV